MSLAAFARRISTGTLVLGLDWAYRVGASNSVSSGEGDNLLVAEAHAVEHVAKVVLQRKRVGKQAKQQQEFLLTFAKLQSFQNLLFVLNPKWKTFLIEISPNSRSYVNDMGAVHS